MSSIKLIKTRHGSEVFRVHYENAVGRFHKTVKTLDAACRFLFLNESERFLEMTAKEKEKCRDWYLRKLIRFYVGKKVSQCETGHLRQSSLDTIKHALFSIDEPFQAKLAFNISPSECNGLPENTLKHLHSAYLLLKEMRNLGVSPLPKLKRKRENPIFIPAFENVDRMIKVAPVREKIAFILASVIWLRISEILALDYSDIQGEYLNSSKHVTRNGVIAGLKTDVQRLLPIPKELLSLLDKERPGLEEALISSQSGKRLSLNYSTTGIIKELLEKCRIRKFHNLRHFAAVRLIKKRNDIHVIFKMLGHKNIETTSNIYGGFLGSIFELNV